MLEWYSYTYPIPSSVDQNCQGKNTNQLCVEFRELVSYNSGW